jgi:glycoside/pentoside/hexuronide:cation symporter, GPH family
VCASLEAKAEDSVPLSRQLALGAGSLASFVGYAGIASLAIPVYQMTLGVDLVKLGLALAVPRIWEALIDPLMGTVSDNFRSRWGRRRPLIVTGAAAMGLVYGLVWMVSPAWSETTQLAYFTSMSVLFFTAYTVFSVPYASLTYEITPDYHERTRVMAHCAFLHKVGEFGYHWVFPLSQLAIFGSALAGVRTVGWAVSLIVLGAIGMIPGLLVRERFPDAPARQRKVTLWPSVRASFSSRPFLVIIGLALLNIIMGMLASNLDHYVLVYYMFHGDVAAGSIWKGLLSSGYAVVGVAAIPVVVWLSSRLGKRETLMALYAFTMVGGVLKWFIFTPGHPGLVLLDPIFCGPIWVAANVLLASMLADVCDEDEFLSGQRREGTFGAIFSWVQKTAVSLSFLGAGIVLALAGFEQRLGGEQAPSTFTTMRWLLAGSTALPPLAAIALLRFYPLDAARAAETRRKLERRRGSVVAAPTADRGQT